MSLYESILANIINNKLIRSVFQPIISLSDGEVLGYEALSRVTYDCELSNIDKLFTVAGEFNCLWDLELLCRTKALEAAYKFMTEPGNKKLFININPRTIHDEKFKTGFTKEFLKQYNIAPKNVIFEITERNVIEDMAGFRATICHYQNQDYKIAVDDAGAGYSGLNLISDVNPNFIKLDIQLIRNVNKDTLKYALVKGMVEFSRVSNVQLIAEGIETYDEMETLINLGVRYGQGYCIQKPDFEIREIDQDIIDFIKKINLKNKNTNKNNIFNTYIKNLCSQNVFLTPDEKVSSVYDRVKSTPNCFGFCITDNNQPIGIITKDKLAISLSGQYGYTLNQNREISHLMDRNFLSVDCETPVNIVSSLAMARTIDSLYDFIVVTEKGNYLGIVTIKDLLLKTIEIEVSTAKHQNPLTGLPGNVMIEHKLGQCLEDNIPFTACYLDIDNFKAYNDVYGFEYGDLVIKLLSIILKENVANDNFIGHIGGDDFVVILDSYDNDCFFEKIVSLFESEVLSFYNQNDVKNGYITTKNRKGEEECFPLLTLTYATVDNKSQKFNNIYEISENLAAYKRIKNKKN